MPKTLPVACLIITCWASTSIAQTPTTPSTASPSTSGATIQIKSDTWAAWRYLLGEWTGVGTGTPGETTGGFTFKTDLSEKVLVRRNYAEYPATKDRPAFRHDDMMIIYPGTGSGTDTGAASPCRAIYFDNEGHVIRYTTEFSADRKLLTFLSEPSQPGPRFRFTYENLSPDTLGIKFDIAPPNKPDAFSTYITAKAYRGGK